MRLRTQFVITMLLFTIILAVIAVSTIFTNQRVATVREQDSLVIIGEEWVGSHRII